jgi:hypothetical protein
VLFEATISGNCSVAFGNLLKPALLIMERKEKLASLSTSELSCKREEMLLVVACTIR